MKRGRWYREPDPGGFKSNRPRATGGGLNSEVRTARAAKSEWARRFLEIVERFGFGLRLQRGRGDARHGLVRTLDVEPGRIEAVVQGVTKPTHAVLVAIAPPDKARADAVIAALLHPTIAAAKLSNGELPADLAAAFEAAGLPLLPDDRSLWQLQCDCGETEQPCRHLAAACCVFAAEVERDPQLLLALRGIDPKELKARLSAVDAAARGDDGSATHGRHGKHAEPVIEEVPLPTDLAKFWLGGELPPLPPVPKAIPSQPGALLRRLGPFPFWRGSSSLTAALEPIYRHAAVTAAAIALGPLFEEAEEEEE